MRPGCTGDSTGLHCTLVTCMNCVPNGTLTWFVFELDYLKLSGQFAGTIRRDFHRTIYMSRTYSVCNFSFLASCGSECLRASASVAKPSGEKERCPVSPNSTVGLESQFSGGAKGRTPRVICAKGAPVSEVEHREESTCAFERKATQ